eukprot:5005204-Amphidinium_carterae.2
MPTARHHGQGGHRASYKMQQTSTHLNTKNDCSLSATRTTKGLICNSQVSNAWIGIEILLLSWMCPCKLSFLASSTSDMLR